MPENTDQNNSEYTHFLGSVFLKLIIISRNTKAVSLDWSYYTASNGSINVILITCILVLLMANQDITVIYSSKSSDIRQTSKPSLLLVQSQQWKRENNV